MIFLYGAGGHGKVILEILELRGEIIGGFLDDNPSCKSFLEYPVSKFDHLNDSLSDTGLIISVGNNRIRKKIAQEIRADYKNAYHPSSNISTRALIKEGTVVMAGVSINSSGNIGKHVIVNTNASIDHDCTLGDYVHVSPNVALAGGVTVGEGTHIGIGACVIPGITIGKWCTIGAGAVIVDNVADGCTVVGNPGRII